MTEQDEEILQFSLVGFRTMTVEMQKAFLVAAMDEFVGMSREGKIDRRTAQQVAFRAGLVADYLNLSPPGHLKKVVNYVG